MFQNITDELKHDEKEDVKLNGEENKVNRLKMLFSIQNIVIYAISFMISMVSFDGSSAPYGLAMFAAVCSNGIPAGAVYISCLLGTLIRFGLGGLLSYILTTLIFVVMILIFRPKYKYLHEARNEKQKLGIYLFASIFIVQVGIMLFDMFLLYDLLNSVITATIAYIFYKIFANSLVVIKDYGIKKAFSIEEVIGASLLLSCAVASISSLKIFELSITNIISIVLVLFLGWKNGMLVGATSGISIGMVLGIITNANPILVASFAISRNDCGDFK